MKIFAFNWNLYSENPEMKNIRYFISKDQAEKELFILTQKAFDILTKHDSISVRAKFSQIYEIEVEE
jgi:hypothetical protein